ncbi:MAG: hypothetical protein UV74_C0013G0575 [Candidatus Woesebacteria bacterium GW2011_GWB1_43_14]|uniref:Uncharacterized protein n=1 Tax=Candidatus Woesebacteria bacterium GW2011_GWB1_43_14 TaxID=1618578 RepID=A0A0G1GF07_9BACT|nr:MAG: hypothetical protein UT21_C0001G0288 [Candidatus Woesebacteria bacterium GW2011_GWA1_39_11b]KKS77968.1 MAG: hypothetical protein UV51_C0003G0003 [Candidatus Woesebacteria bacterium GW2011_GWC1_42_9]KKS97453.1 MAG: hypothetical protein UV74_C0013G0575 [Candidatus Woesebacteria bacterium GW2011_GWB1_43_14]
MTPMEYKNLKGLKRENLRDHNEFGGYFDAIILGKLQGDEGVCCDF